VKDSGCRSTIVRRPDYLPKSPSDALISAAYQLICITAPKSSRSWIMAVILE
jgi:hypothetical protein